MVMYCCYSYDRFVYFDNEGNVECSAMIKPKVLLFIACCQNSRE